MSSLKTIVLDPKNLSAVCRLCLENNPNLYPLFTTGIKVPNPNFPHKTVGDMLVEVTSELVREERGFPTSLCPKCVDLLSTAYMFRLQFEQATKILEFVLSTISSDNKVDLPQNTSKDEGLGNQIVNAPVGEPKIEEDLSGLTDSEPENITDDDDSDNSDDSFEKYTTGPSTSKLFSFPCPICTVELPTPFSLKQHVHTHKTLRKHLQALKVPRYVSFYAKPRKTLSIFNRKEILHKCLYCDRELSADEFWKHLEHHTKQAKFKCNQCDRVFRRINNLNMHRITHLKEYPYSCKHCKKGFVMKSNYDCHMLTHTASVTEFPHECTYCFRRFANPTHLYRHKMIHTKNVKYDRKYKVYKCPKCLLRFKLKTELEDHVCKMQHILINNRFPCKLCSKVFKYTSSLHNHINYVHNNKRKKCQVCGLCVKNIHSHMLVHKGEKLHQCEMCGKCFGDRAGLSQHLRTHTGERPFQCNKCPNKYPSKQNLKRHLLCVHSDAKPYVCSFCGKAYNDLYNMRVHERLHNSNGKRSHICVVCNKGFLEKSYLRQHISKVHKYKK